MYYSRVYTNAFIRDLRMRYPEGTRIEVISMEDPCASKLYYGDQGTVKYIDGNANFYVAWDNGSTAILAYDDDVFRSSIEYL